VEIDTRSEADLPPPAASARRPDHDAARAAGVLFIAVLLGTWATHTLVEPITRLRRSMAAVSAGEFVVPGGLPYDRATRSATCPARSAA
jgi:hypothetical protein